MTWSSRSVPDNSRESTSRHDAPLDGRASIVPWCRPAAAVGTSEPQDAQRQIGLAQGKVEDEPEHQHQLDRRIRVPGLAAGRRRPWRLPPSDGSLIIDPAWVVLS
jgi:hypothetical protein